MTLITLCGEVIIIMGRVCIGGRVLGDLYRHNDLEIFQHSCE